ncbi:BnaA06g13860D [Brassica napus]|uniref:BnaA06g13860D protein n=1 Tax=Brassica napus TaxID=3708 RepID=A0A078GSD8_BRANA|nr:BnaA06g13860D [Brassica napus]
MAVYYSSNANSFMTVKDCL